MGFFRGIYNARKTIAGIALAGAAIFATYELGSYKRELDAMTKETNSLKSSLAETDSENRDLRGLYMDSIQIADHREARGKELEKSYRELTERCEARIKGLESNLSSANAELARRAENERKLEDSVNELKAFRAPSRPARAERFYTQEDRKGMITKLEAEQKKMFDRGPTVFKTFYQMIGNPKKFSGPSMQILVDGDYWTILEPKWQEGSRNPDRIFCIGRFRGGRYSDFMEGLGGPNWPTAEAQSQHVVRCILGSFDEAYVDDGADGKVDHSTEPKDKAEAGFGRALSIVSGAFKR